MENKYYTPTIEEFHVGFEYEEQNVQGDFKSNFFPTSLEEDFATPPILWGIECKAIRVKYLDQEDIESLGWKYDVNMSERDWDSFYIEPGLDEKKRFIQYSMNNYRNGKIYLEKTIDCGGHEIGEMTIRNKSELRKLMQQLKIC